MNDHVAKPIDPDNLFETVGRFYRTPPVTPRSATAAATPDGPGSDRAQPGSLDRRAGLARVAGNEALYLKLLHQFLDQQAPAVAQVTEALAQGDRPLAERLAHTLKGVAGNIGAMQVHAAAAALEQLIHGGAAQTAIQAATNSVAAALDPLLADLRRLPPLPSSAALAVFTPAESVSAEDTRAAASKLAALLTDLDPGAADFVEAQHAALRPLMHGDAWAGFATLVQNYDFAEAHTQLEQALQRFSTT